MTETRHVQPGPWRNSLRFIGRDEVTWREAMEGSSVTVTLVAACAAIGLLINHRRRSAES